MRSGPSPICVSCTSGCRGTESDYMERIRHELGKRASETFMVLRNLLSHFPNAIRITLQRINRSLTRTQLGNIVPRMLHCATNGFLVSPVHDATGFVLLLIEVIYDTSIWNACECEGYARSCSCTPACNSSCIISQEILFYTDVSLYSILIQLSVVGLMRQMQGCKILQAHDKKEPV